MPCGTVSVDSIQSTQYKFPYHYLPGPKRFPYFTKRWKFAPSYIAAIKLAEDWLLSLKAEGKHRHIDYGCGDGGFVNALLNLREWRNIAFEGVDYDENAIRWAKIFSTSPQSFNVIDLADLPAETYDSGTLIEVFEHIPPGEGERFIANLAKSLKKSALLFVTVPSSEKPVPEKHYRHFDFQQLADCFRNDFEIVEQFGFEKPDFLTRVFTGLFTNKSIYIETKPTSKHIIKSLKRKHRSLKGCGRIGLILKKR